jgi:hypothetical protein
MFLMHEVAAVEPTPSYVNGHHAARKHVAVVVWILERFALDTTTAMEWSFQPSVSEEDAINDCRDRRDISRLSTIRRTGILLQNPTTIYACIGIKRRNTVLSETHRCFLDQ